MKILDAHCDTLSVGLDLRRNSGTFDTERAVRRGGGVQLMAAFGEDQEAQLRRLAQEREALALPDPNILALVPALEGADTVRSLDDAQRFLSLGVRCFGLTWNHSNALATGCMDESVSGGLTDLGREIIALCESQRVTIDLAHASETTFYDVLACAARPPVVTHACMAALRPHTRNLSDAQLRALGDRGGVVGVTFYVPFLTNQAMCTLDEVIRHICHAVNVSGEDAVGIGSDFDGCDRLPEGLEDTEALPRLIERLPLPDRVREKVAYCNFARVLVY